ncbi:unnamed protein product [Peronospora belbahrii]|uniref:Cytochrome c oxidase subunit n=1 Tax=Peronospora belbahrii TaxID=622444 RepID=A0AAU9KRB2_9STRA|nr:unnamed protein product [Peronospora belbahrii]
MPSGEAKLKTTPLDPRFPNQNQAQHCWTRYNEFVLCLKSNDGDEDACHKYLQYAASVCPSSWMDRWNEQREEGTFQGVQYAKEE